MFELDQLVWHRRHNSVAIISELRRCSHPLGITMCNTCDRMLYVIYRQATRHNQVIMHTACSPELAPYIASTENSTRCGGDTSKCINDDIRSGIIICNGISCPYGTTSTDANSSTRVNTVGCSSASISSYIVSGTNSIMNNPCHGDTSKCDSSIIRDGLVVCGGGQCPYRYENMVEFAPVISVGDRVPYSYNYVDGCGIYMIIRAIHVCYDRCDKRDQCSRIKYVGESAATGFGGITTCSITVRQLMGRLGL